jgi:hypothetical protein
LWRKAWAQLPDEELMKQGKPFGWAVVEDGAVEERREARGFRALGAAAWSAGAVPGSPYLMIACAGGSFLRSGTDTILWQGVVRPAGDRGFLGLATERDPFSALPYCFKGMLQPANVTEEQRKAFQYYLPGQQYVSYRQVSLLPGARHWYLAGLRDSNETGGQLWVSRSDDQGKTWSKPNILENGGNHPHLFSLRDGTLCLIYTNATLGYQTSWPDDNYPGQPNKQQWPSAKRMMFRLSSSEGQEWSNPKEVTSFKDVVQACGTETPDGTIWVVFVRTDVDHVTTLWLTSSRNRGQTWSSPRQLTDGKYTDREPSMVWQSGKLLIAFTRGGLGINTNVWMIYYIPESEETGGSRVGNDESGRE